MIPADKGERIHLVVAVSLLGVLAVACVVLWYTSYLSRAIQIMCQAFSGREALRTYVESWGAWAPLVFIVLQGLQVVIAPIPGELTGCVGGFIFGAWHNVLYSTIGLTVGSILGFAGARIIGLPLVKLFVSAEFLHKFHFLTERRGTILALVLFTFPGFPKDFLCYVLGLSPMGFVTFLLVCFIGRLPGTVMLSYSGSAVYDENWTLVIAVTVICVIMMGIVFLTKDKVERWLCAHGHTSLAKCDPGSTRPATSDGPVAPS
jgi:uncharacterized membrane protein YdjX (TVP38/TMEM64 family)